MSSTPVNEEAVRSALARVLDPELDRDLVTLDRIKDVTVTDNTVQLQVLLPTPAYPHRERLEAEIQEVVASVPGVGSVSLTFDAEVLADGRARPLMEAPVRNAVAIGSGKGGVGKSTVAANVAVALAQTGTRVGLLDADIYGPNLPTMMGVQELPPQSSEKLIPAEAHGVKLMSIGFLVRPEQPLIWRGPMLHKAIEQFLSDVVWGELDYLIVDLPPGTGDAALSVSQSLALTGGVIVTLPQQVSLDDARRGLEMFRQLDVDILGVVENMSYLELDDGSRVDVFGMGGGERLAEAAEVPFLGGIPMDPAVREGGDEGVPILLAEPEAPVSHAMRRVAENIAAKLTRVAYQEDSDLPINLVG